LIFPLEFIQPYLVQCFGFSNIFDLSYLKLDQVSSRKIKLILVKR
jgi:hypothetical protein